MHADLLQAAVIQLKGVGPQMAGKLQRLNIHTIQDCLFHFPFRYQDRTRVTPIGQLRLHQDALLEGAVVSTHIGFGRRRSLICKIQDDSGVLTLRFFHFSAAQKKQLQNSQRIRCFGEARRGASGLEFYHPEYEMLSGQEESSDALLEKNLTPVYPITEGVTQAAIRKIMTQALDLLENNNIETLLPVSNLSINTSAEVSLKRIILFLHRPDNLQEANLLLKNEHPYQQILALEELVAHHLNLLRAREKIKQRQSSAFPEEKLLTTKLLEALPFDLTASQQRVQQEIASDLQQAHPMLRLVQGDVGSGKTLVAALAALQVIAEDKQVVLMAPTEILAAQHYKNFQQWFNPLGIEVAYLTGSLKVSEKKQQKQTIANGTAKMVIGTHALFQDDVQYSQLCLAIIDEQHRFGVQQRLSLVEKALVEKAHYPHQLIMTATPIPRTLAMSVYADLDCSTIDELPPGRTPIQTVLIDQQRREQVIQRVQVACSEGRQAYWVCTLIEESEDLQCEAAETTAATLAKLLPDLNVALVHGKQKPAMKTEAMQAFKQGDIDVLVATTVIEVGVDVANASLMVIENPERLGLSQLHQLRGRVGRGNIQSHCVLLYSMPLSSVGRERLSVMRESNDGFVIAEKDLQLRGPGEFLGTRQTGDLNFRLADIERDANLLPEAKKIAEQLIKKLPDKVTLLIQRWQQQREQFAQA